MFTKVLTFCAIAAVALAVEYPAGIHPAVCPNYPYCDVEVLARHTPQGIPIPEWELPYARMVMPYPYPYPIMARSAAATPAAVEPAAEPIVEPARYPADFDPTLCPNYPYCT